LLLFSALLLLEMSTVFYEALLLLTDKLLLPLL